MLKIILVLCAVLAVAKGHAGQVSSYEVGDHGNSVVNAQDYVDMNRQQYGSVLGYFDSQIKKFKDQYKLRLEGIKLLIQMTTTNIENTEDRLKPLAILSDSRKQCVRKYAVSLPRVQQTSHNMGSCYYSAINQLDSMLNSSNILRNNLENYYLNAYDKRIHDCSSSNYPSANYTACLTAATAAANAETRKSEKLFAQFMDAAECDAKAFVKIAYDCTSMGQNDVTAKLTAANLLIDRCIDGKDECKPCKGNNDCASVEVDVTSAVLHNPLYGPQNKQTCITLRRPLYH